MQRLAAEIGEKRLAMILKQRDADLHAIRTADLNEDQFADAMSQFEEKYSRLGIPDPVNLPALSEQYSSDNQNPEAVLARNQERYPHVPWQIHPDGKVGPPPGWKLEFDPAYRAEQQQNALDLKEVVRQQREEEAVQRREQLAEDRRIRAHEFQFRAAERALEKRAPNRDWFVIKIPGEQDRFDEASYNAAMDKWQQEHDALFNKFFGDGSAPISPAVPGAPGPPTSSSPPQWFLDLPSGAVFTAPDGTKRIKP